MSHAFFSFFSGKYLFFNVHNANNYLSVLFFLFFFPVHVEDIILHMFQYIQKLCTEGPQEWVFQECKV